MHMDTYVGQTWQQEIHIRTLILTLLLVLEITTHHNYRYCARTCSDTGTTVGWILNTLDVQCTNLTATLTEVSKSPPVDIMDGT